jgi:hypothetical protein
MSDIQNQRSFSPAQRVRLCLTCGATMTAPLEGGDVSCGRCSTLVTLPPRALEPLGEHADAGVDVPLETEEKEQARLAMLRKQLQQYNRSNRYATVEASESGTLDEALAAYREAFARCEGQPIAQHEQAVYWLTWKLNNIYVQQNASTHAWSVIQTSLDVLTDAGYQHILRTMAADKARKAGELDSAEAWLRLCDPAPRILDLDTDYRTSLAALHGARGQWDRALALVGLGVFDVPFEPSARLVVGATRVAALESLGRSFEAEEAMRELQATALGHSDALQNMLASSSVYAPARAAWARVKQQDGSTESLVRDDEMLPPGSKLRAGAGILAILALGALAGGVYQVSVAFDYQSWKPVKGKIQRVVTTEVKEGSEHRVGVGVAYTYQVDGKAYRGNKVEPDHSYFTYSTDKDAEKKAASLRAQRDVTVYHHPEDPSRSALERAWLGELLGAILLFAIAAGLLLGTFFLVKVHRRRHRAHQQWKAREGGGGAGSGGDGDGDGDGAESAAS